MSTDALNALAESVHTRLNSAAMKRKKGDRLRKLGREEDATTAFMEALPELEAAISSLRGADVNSLKSSTHGKSVEDVQLFIANELVECYGSRAGILRRLGRNSEAFHSYSEGAEVERQFRLPTTYNRVNTLKYSLLSGDKTLADLQEEAETLERLLNKQLGEDELFADGSWNWADLGDCRALLGDVEGAENAYKRSITKSSTTAPQTTLEVIDTVARALEARSDPGAPGVRGCVESLRQRLT